jgi:hypothetical protein
MKQFDPTTPKNQKALDETSEWMGRHELTIHEVMDMFASFMVFASIQSGDPGHFMKELTRLLLMHLTKHEAK